MILPSFVARLLASRALRAIALLAATSAVLGAVFSYETATRGLLSPSATPHLGVIALGLAFLLTRVIVLFCGPAVVAFCLVEEVTAWARRSR